MTLEFKVLFFCCVLVCAELPLHHVDFFLLWEYKPLNKISCSDPSQYETDTSSKNAKCQLSHITPESSLNGFDGNGDRHH